MSSEDRKKVMNEQPEPYWRESVSFDTYPPLSQDTEVEIAIVGGGIAGITAGYELARQGKKVAIIEAGSILNGTTGHTTAKITAQHGLIYDELIQHFGVDLTKTYYQANDDALQYIKKNVRDLQIDCDLTEEDAYVYAITEKYDEKVRNEFTAYNKLGIDGELVDKLPIDLDIKSAVIMKKQAQYHPLKYLKVLVDEFTNHGGTIYENTTAVDIQEGSSPSVVTRDGHKVNCSNVLICSHFPFFDGKGFYFAKMYASRSYILGVKAKKEFPGGMYLNAESPSRSLRYTDVNGEKLILVGGEDHKTGQGKDTVKHYEALEEYAEAVLGIEELSYRWSAQDLISVDKVPYIGQLTANHKNIFVATGFKKWGMTSGTAAGMILSDLIVKKASPYEEIFSPSRFVADPSIKHYLEYNGDVAKHLIKGKLTSVSKSPADLRNGEAAHVSVNGQKGGAFKDDEGTLHIVDTTCTHMGCEVHWNHGERTWDCPCHGSRFSIGGEVLEGPAKKPLKKLKY
ncbi:FAD-dependent oxidoreductase [Bacillus sp. P14.5]|uniref:FAD-dependent oxidoreductase n=1 Tax=Bacillus sp. P14.5 TaxID=1983400 RepID=UPI000DEB5CB5|nr:FAD-dependent oxidoreductase [Bacillus sp. P14.5]